MAAGEKSESQELTCFRVLAPGQSLAWCLLALKVYSRSVSTAVPCGSLLPYLLLLLYQLLFSAHTIFLSLLYELIQGTFFKISSQTTPFFFKMRSFIATALVLLAFVAVAAAQPDLITPEIAPLIAPIVAPAVAPIVAPVAEPTNVTEPIAEPSNVTIPIFEPSNVTEPIAEPSNVTIPIAEPVNVTEPVISPDVPAILIPVPITINPEAVVPVAEPFGVPSNITEPEPSSAASVALAVPAVVLAVAAVFF